MLLGPNDDPHLIRSIDGREGIVWERGVTSSMGSALSKYAYGHYKPAKKIFKRCMEEFEEKPDIDSQAGLFYQEKLASILRKRGELKKAFKICTEVTQVKRSDYTQYPATTLCSVGELCRTLRDQDKLLEAFQALRQGFESFDIEPYDNMRSTKTMSVFGRACEDSGALKLSEIVARDVLSAAGSHLGEDLPYVAKLKLYLSSALAMNGHIQAAKHCSQQAMDIIGQIRAGYFPRLVFAAEALGNCFRYSGDPQTAREMLEWSVKGFKNQDSGITLAALKSQGFLAVTYALLGRTSESESKLRKVAQEQEKMLPASHRDRIWTREALYHIEKLNIGETKDSDAWIGMGTKTCTEAFDFFMSPQRPGKAINEKITQQYWPEYPYEEFVSLLPQDKRDQLQTAVGACRDREELGVVLRLAAACGYPEAVETLLNGQVPINSKGGFYGTALQAACAAGHDSLVEILIKRRAYVNATGGVFGSPLRAAVFHGDEKIVNLLLKSGADPYRQDQKLTSVLHTALAIGRPDLALLLLKHFPKLARVPDVTYGDPLQEACAKGYLEVVRALLGCGIDPAAKGGIFGSALNAAHVKGDDKIVLEISRHMGPTAQVERLPAKKLPDLPKAGDVRDFLSPHVP